MRLVLCCGFVDEETQFIVKLCCLKVEVRATTHAIFAKLKQIIEEHGFDWTQYKPVATNGATVMEGSTE